MPHLTELLTFELSPCCNLGESHTDCPNTSLLRIKGIDSSRRLTDQAIVSTAVAMYREHHFRGLVTWHYYSEPLLLAKRMFRLMAAIRDEVPYARFLLWTNGNLIPEDCRQFEAFDQIHVTDYGSAGGDDCLHPPKNLDALRQYCGDVRIHPGVLDRRLTAGSDSNRSNKAPCVRQFTEMVFDAWGHMHVCCYGWRGRDTVGSLLDEPLPVLIQRWQQIRESICGLKMTCSAPPVCLRCGMRARAFTTFAPEIAAAAGRYVKQKRERERDRKPGVIFVHYKIPEKRLHDHFVWNDRLYREAGARVYVTTDREYAGLPKYAKCLVYDKPMPTFCLAATKNHAIQAALADGCTHILSSDVDIALPRPAWNQFLDVRPTTASIPNYRMIRVYEEREADAPLDIGATGVVGMVADAWRLCPYDERFVGYGAEDGALRLAISKLGIRELRNLYIWHVAHDPNASQVNTPGHGRNDAWNRDTINPDNFPENLKLVEEMRRQ